MEQEAKQDKQLVCQNCQETFEFTAGEQEWFDQKGFTEPKKCKKCRDEARQNRGNFNKRNDYFDQN